MIYRQGETTYKTYNSDEKEMVSVNAEDGEVIEVFESSGCVYDDLGCCQGCWVCRIHDEDY